MRWMIPGTALWDDRERSDTIADQFGALFLAGGMVLNQVCTVTGLEAYTIQNWVKRGFLTPPVNKRYSLRQLCRIININMLKGALPMDKICGLLGYVNGHLDDESDDIIDDSALYFMFVRLAARLKEAFDPAVQEKLIADELAMYEEPLPGAKKRVEKALRIMLTAWLAARMRQEAERMLEDLNEY